METKDKVIEIVEPMLEAKGVELVDVDCRREGRGQVVRLFVDRDGGIDLDSISILAREISDVLDADDPIPGRYTLEVSSPGIDRPLRTPEHFRRFVGKKVRVRTRTPLDGRRQFQGTLRSADDRGIVIEVEGGPTVDLAFGDLDRANYQHEFSSRDFAPARVSRR